MTTEHVDEYEVSLSCTFEADGFEDALEQGIEWATNYSYVAGYRVTNLDTGESRFIDAERFRYEQMTEQLTEGETP